MNFGLLCDDPAAAWLLSAVRHHPAHAVTRAVLVSPRADDLLHGLAGMKCSDRWEDLLADECLEAVIVGGTSPVVWDGARQLASEGIPLLVFPTVTAGPAILYELSLIRDDRQGILFPCWPQRYDPAILRLHRLVRSADRPAISYLHWDQELALGFGREVPQAVIEEELLRATDLLHFLFGAADQVTALRTGGTATGALIQSIVLSGRAIPESTWAIKSAEASSSRLTLHTEGGPWLLEWDAARSHWKLSESPTTPAKSAVGDGGTVSSRLDSADLLLAEFTAAVAGGTKESHWTDVLHAAEIVDAMQRSLDRRRTIDLHHETLSERAIFKTQMAATGCALLMLTLVVMVGYLALDTIAPWNRHVLKGLLVISTAPMFVYLFVQMLLPLTRSSGAAK